MVQLDAQFCYQIFYSKHAQKNKLQQSGTENKILFLC